MPGPRVTRIDHVHVHVRDREAAAQWYADILGLVPSALLAEWAEDPRGPLMMSTADGGSHVALFRDPAGGGGRTVAFSIDGDGFLAFLDALASFALHLGGKPVGRADVVDHELAWSIYFNDRTATTSS